MAQGSIITRVYTSDAYLPLSEVPVIYTQTASNGTKELLSIKMTDSSGLTEPYYISTPDAAASQTPGGILKPYALIDISVAFPGYGAVTAEGVQIFPDIQTIQNLQLRPIPPSQAGTTDFLQEPAQNL